MLPFAVVLTVTWAHLSLTDDPVWGKPEARVALTVVIKKLATCNAENRVGAKERVNGLHDAFDALLDAVGEAEAKRIAKGEDRLSAKLLAIALDRRKNPDLYDELGKAYGDHTRRDSRPKREWDFADQSRGGPSMLDRLGLDDKHLDEKYRLAWEYRLLVLPQLLEMPARTGSHAKGYSGKSIPGVGMMKFKFSCPTLDAVYAFKDERSLVTLVESYKFMQLGSLLEGDSILTYFDCLAAHPTEKGLRAILDWAEWTERLWEEKITAKGYKNTYKFTPADLVKGLAEKDADHWRTIAEKLPIDALTVREKELRVALIAECKKR